MDTDTIPDVPNDNPETYCRLCFSGFYVEPIFPRDGPPKNVLIELVGQHVDIHLTLETDRSCMVCRMCQMTLESFHKYRNRCRTLDEVLQRRRIEVAEFRVKEEKQVEQLAPTIGFEQNTIYCLSDSDEDDGDGREEAEDDPEAEAVDEYEEAPEEMENDADEEDLIRGDMLIKPEPYGVAEDAAYEEGQEEYQQPMLPRKRERFDADEVVELVDSEEELADADESGTGGRDDGEHSMAASTRASSEAPGQAEDPEPDKPLPYEVTDDGAYRCTICRESFRLMKEIKSHIRKEHPQESQIYSCKYCHKKFCNISALRIHSRYHTMDFPFSCDECGAKFTAKERLDRHVSRYHDKNSPSYTEKRFSCPLCPRVFLQEQGRHNHIYHFHDVRPDNLSLDKGPLPKSMVYFCEPCEVSFESLDESKAHIAEKHPQEEGDEGAEGNAAVPQMVKRSKCPDCGKLFRNSSAFRSHVITNHGTMPLVCDICGSGFQRQAQMKRHKERWHGENARNKGVLERYKCDHCERFFMRNQDRIRHEQIIHHIETPEKLPAVWEGRKSNFPCSKCDRKFPSMKTMRIHFSLKHPDVAVRFKCTVCSKLFRHKQTLREHMSNHTGEQPYHCEQCNERFIRKKDFDRHMQDFHGPDDSGDEEEKQRFPCPFCPRKLLTRTARVMHVRHHHADKPELSSLTKEILGNLPKGALNCTYCPKVFNNRNTFKLHLMNHMGKMPHPCDLCDAGFYKPADLQRHKQRYHVGGSALSLASRFKCAYCPRVFIRKSARRYHHTVFHGVEKKVGGITTGRSRGKSGVKPDPDAEHPCSLCSLTFVTSTMLETHHQQQHPDQEFFYKCPHCPRRTTHRQAYLSHVKLHSGGHRYPCDECTAKFDRKISLVTHKKRYHGTASKDGTQGPAVAMFKCTMCSREFMRNQDRVRHQQLMHNYQVQGSAESAAAAAGSSRIGAGRSLLKIKQERTEPKAVETKPLERSRDGFSVSSDVEEDYGGAMTEEGAVEAPVGEEEGEEDVPSVPTIACVVSIKEEAMASRRVDHGEYPSEF